MAEKHRLRRNRAGTIINLTSKQQESNLGQALELATAQLLKDFGLKMSHKKKWKLPEIVERLSKEFANFANSITQRIQGASPGKRTSTRNT